MEAGQRSDGLEVCPDFAGRF